MKQPGFYQKFFSLLLTVLQVCLLIQFLAVASVVSAAPGDLIWRYQAEGSVSSPVIGSDGTVYAGSTDDHLYAINPDGSLKWRYKTDKTINSKPAIGPDGTVYVNNYNDSLYAINPDSSLKWKYETKNSSMYPCSPVVGADGTIYVGGTIYSLSSKHHYLHAINSEGSLVWNFPQSPTHPYINADVFSPALGNNLIYIGTGTSYLYAVSLFGWEHWRYETGKVMSSPLAGPDGTVYAGSENDFVYAINPDGSLKWKYKTGDNIISAPAIDSYGVIYIGCDDDYLYAINPDGTLNWKYKTDHIIRSAPVIGTDDTVYAGSWDRYLYAIRPDGILKWKYETGSAIKSSPVIGDGGVIYVGSSDNYLYAIEGSVYTCIQGGAGDISANPVSGEFENVFPSYSSPPIRFAIKNTGDGCEGLEIHSVAVTGENKSEFILENHNCSGKLGQNRKCSADVFFSPTTPGPKSATLSISSNDPDTPELNIPLEADAKDPYSLDLICTKPGTDTLLEPTIISENDGNWNDANTWDLNRIPGKNDVVLVRHNKITNVPSVVEINTLCNYGELVSMPDSSLEIRAPGGISNYMIGIIRGQDGEKDPSVNECGNPGKDVILKTATDVKKYNKAGDWWWEAEDAGPIYNDGRISGGNGADGPCGGKGGDALVLGRNVTNDVSGVIKAGKGGNSDTGKGGQGGLAQIFGKIGGPGKLISRGTVTAGDGGDGTYGGNGGNLWFVSLPDVYLGATRARYSDNPVLSKYHAGIAGKPYGNAGWIRIEPNVISIGAGAEIKGGDITIFGGNDWILDFTEAEDTVIESAGDITLSAGNKGVIDLTGNTETLLKAGGKIKIFADDVLLDEDVNLYDISQSTEIETGPGKIIRDVILTGAGQVAAQAGSTIAVRITLSNGGPASDTYRVSAKNSEGESLGSHIEVELEGLDSADLDLEVTMPPTTEDTDIITITAVSLSDPGTVSQTEVKLSAQPVSYFIDENSAKGTSVCKVMPGDMTGTLTYAITEGNTNNIFLINRANGEITINDTSLLNYEAITTYTLTVQVSDGVKTVTNKLRVNINDLNEKPVVSSQVFFANENSANGTVIATVMASDEDNDTLGYSIVKGNESNIFAINNVTGEITINNSHLLNYESAAAHAMTVQISDGANISAADVTVNINDLNEKPVVNDQALYVVKNSASGTMIGAITANDEDGDMLTYSITAGNNNAFGINRNTGEISVDDASLLDYDTDFEYALTVRVSDGKYSDSARVTLGLNNIPILNGQTFFVDENSSSGTLVGRAEAGDADDDPLAYSITSGNADKVFAISADTGQIMVSNGTLLDYETTVAYAMTVQVSDGKHSVSAPITVSVRNMNDNLPEIHDMALKIDENSPNGTVVGRVEATDADGYVHTYRIKGGNENNAFAMKPFTGEIIVNDRYQLDYENIRAYALAVRVFDGDSTDTATVTVSLTNLNDNAPVVNDQVFFIDENIPDGRIFGMAGASDADNDPLTYSIISGNLNNAFAVNPDTGYLSVNSSQLDSETASLTVQVSDGTYTDTAAVAVHLFKTGPIPGDADGNGIADLGDAIMVLKVLTGIAEGDIFAEGDANGDVKIGLEDIIYILQKISILRQK